uniref:Uncharacterized protein n=1 Tax=Rhizophora mucronata TaxID=61149 RepID=A0A2P2Q8Q0_RHIMU
MYAYTLGFPSYDPGLSLCTANQYIMMQRNERNKPSMRHILDAMN